jgi:hypothetical protein
VLLGGNTWQVLERGEGRGGEGTGGGEGGRVEDITRQMGRVIFSPETRGKEKVLRRECAKM